MLNDGKLGQHLCIEHLDHALVNLAPPVPDPGDVKQDRRVLPKWTFFDVIDESNGREVHVHMALVLNNGGFGYIRRFGGAADGALQWHGVLRGRDGSGELGRAEDVWYEGVVIEAPYAVGAGGFEGICEDEGSYHSQVTRFCYRHTLATGKGCLDHHTRATVRTVQLR